MSSSATPTGCPAILSPSFSTAMTSQASDSVGQVGVTRVGMMGNVPAGEELTCNEVTDCEASSPARAAVITWMAGLAPLDLGGTGELKGAAGGEVEEQQRRFGVHGEVAEAVEQVVAGIVGPP